MVIAFYFLAIIQSSFLVHFSVWGIVPNFVLIAAILINIFNFPQCHKLILSFFAGFFLDVFSLSSAAGFFGFYTLILVGFYLVIKVISEKYVRFRVIQKK